MYSLCVLYLHSTDKHPYTMIWNMFYILWDILIIIDHLVSEFMWLHKRASRTNPQRSIANGCHWYPNYSTSAHWCRAMFWQVVHDYSWLYQELQSISHNEEIPWEVFLCYRPCAIGPVVHEDLPHSGSMISSFGFIMRSHEGHGVPDNSQLDCLLNNLFNLTPKKPSKVWLRYVIS